VNRFFKKEVGTAAKFGEHYQQSLAMEGSKNLFYYDKTRSSQGPSGNPASSASPSAESLKTPGRLT
jgi:hypothetical protein